MHGLTLFNLFGKVDAAYYFFTFMFMPVVTAIMTRNKRHCSWIRNSMSLVCSS